MPEHSFLSQLLGLTRLWSVGFRGYIGIKETVSASYKGYIGTMENKMEATILGCIGIIESIMGLYRDNGKEDRN